VNYRKVLGKDRVKADEIRLYAVCTRRPKSILSLQGVTEANPGVYDILVLKRKIRIIVLSEIPIKKDFIMAHLGELDPEMRLKCLDPETRLKGLNPEIIEALSEEVEKTENELTLKKRRTRSLGQPWGLPLRGNYHHWYVGNISITKINRPGNLMRCRNDAGIFLKKS
jgi:hypothetical protein